MSLLNDVLRDLQTRGVFGVPPLAGLQAVTEIPAHQRKRALFLPILAGVFVASTIVMWRPVTDGRWLPSFAGIADNAADNAPSETQSDAQADTMIAVQDEPASVAATGDDLRELFSVDNPAASGTISQDDFVADTATVSPSAVESAPPVVADFAVESSAAMAAPAFVDASPPTTEPVTGVAPPAPKTSVAPETGTGVMRREPAADDAQGLVTRALKAMRSNDLFTAESMFRAALVVESGDVETWSYLYSVLARTSRPEAAERALQQGLVAADEPAALAKLYARMLLDRGEKDAAISLLKIPPCASTSVSNIAR